MKLDSRSGATLAAAATLFLAGAAVSTISNPANAAAGSMAANACKGQSACKGNGLSMTSEKQCGSLGGKFVKS